MTSRKDTSAAPSGRHAGDDEDTLAEAIAAWVVDCAAGGIPAEVVDRGWQHVLDTFGVMVAGIDSPAGRTFLRWLIDRPRAEGAASAVGIRDPVEASTAALLNGVCAHALDFDDQNYALPGHSSAVVLPAVLAAAEDAGADSTELVTGFVIGTEVACTLGMTLDPFHFQQGWHATATVGVFGAAAGCAAVYGCDTTEVVHALGLAATASGGVRANNPAMAKAYHVGHAAQAGVVSAQLAMAGVTASPHIFEGKDGFAQTYNRGRIDPAPIRGLGAPFALIDPGLMVKRYPACSGAAAAIDALLEIMDRAHLTPDEVDSVDCELTPLGLAGMPNDRPETALAARFSVPYVLSAALTRGAVDVDAFTTEAFGDLRIHALAARVTARTDPRAEWAPASGPESATVTVRTRDGRTLREYRQHPRGAPAEPLHRHELEEKARSCASRVMGTSDAEALLRDLRALETGGSLAAVGSRLRQVEPPPADSGRGARG